MFMRKDQRAPNQSPIPLTNRSAAVVNSAVRCITISHGLTRRSGMEPLAHNTLQNTAIAAPMVME